MPQISVTVAAQPFCQGGAARQVRKVVRPTECSFRNSSSEACSRIQKGWLDALGPPDRPRRVVVSSCDPACRQEWLAAAAKGKCGKGKGGKRQGQNQKGRKGPRWSVQGRKEECEARACTAAAAGVQGIVFPAHGFELRAQVAPLHPMNRCVAFVFRPCTLGAGGGKVTPPAMHLRMQQLGLEEFEARLEAFAVLDALMTRRWTTTFDPAALPAMSEIVSAAGGRDSSLVRFYDARCMHNRYRTCNTQCNQGRPRRRCRCQ